MKTKTTLLFLALILFACAQNFSTPEPPPTQFPTITPFVLPATESVISAPTENVPTGPKIMVTVATPHIDQPPDDHFLTPSASQQDCGFTWAYHDLPDVTDELNASVKNLNPNASAHATAFGEDCLGNDGKVVRFAAMETDFYVFLPATDLNDYETFGNWIAQVMQIVNSISPDMLAGPKPGFVEFVFVKSDTEQFGVRVPLDQYDTTANGATGEELFRKFYTAP